MPVKRRAERPGQRRRTRKAIVDAAIALLAAGRTPSVHEVAVAADVSRRTVYLYFPTFDQLLMDATLGALSQSSVDQAIDSSSDTGSIDERVERLVRSLHHVSPDVERLGRKLIRLTVDEDRPDGGTDMPRRGYRRIEWIEKAIEPLRHRLTPARWKRLVSALAMVIGWEPLIVQRDVCGLSAEEGEELSVWAAHALVKAAVREARADRGRRAR